MRWNDQHPSATPGNPIVATTFGAAYAVKPSYGIGFSSNVYLWLRLLGNVSAVMVTPLRGRLSDKIRRWPPIIIGCLG